MKKPHLIIIKYYLNFVNLLFLKISIVIFFACDVASIHVPQNMCTGQRSSGLQGKLIPGALFLDLFYLVLRKGFMYSRLASNLLVDEDGHELLILQLLPPWH